MRRAPLSVVLALFSLANAEAASVFERERSIRESEQRRVEARQKVASRYWSWQNELTRKGRTTPANAHPWLDKLRTLHGREAGEYLRDRGFRADDDAVYLRVETKKGWSDDVNWVRELGAQLIWREGPVGALIKIAPERSDALIRDPRVGRVRPSVSDEERLRLSQRREQRIRLAGRRDSTTEKWRSPVADGEIDVLKSAVAVNFIEGVSREKAQEILFSYGCWIDEENPDLQFARYIAKCDGGQEVQRLLDTLGADPDTAYVDAVALVIPALMTSPQ